MHDEARTSTPNRPARGAFAAFSQGAAPQVALGVAIAALVVAALGSGGSDAGLLVRRADAGPPPPSALNMQQNRDAIEQIDALDPGRQRLEMVAELRALREELRELRLLVTSGRMKTEVTNLDRIRLEIDYARLRDAIRTEK